MIFTLYGPEEAVAALTQLLKDRFQLSEAGILHYLLGHERRQYLVFTKGT